MLTPKKILFCSDFSENSEPAFRVAVSYAKTFGAALVIVNIINARYLRHPALVDLPVYDEAFEAVQKKAQELLQEIEANCRKELPDVKAYSRIGIPGAEITKLAAEESVDLIVMGTHGRTGFTHLLLGSTAETVVRTAPCPVLTVKA